MFLGLTGDCHSRGDPNAYGGSGGPIEISKLQGTKIVWSCLESGWLGRTKACALNTNRNQQALPLLALRPSV